jgi:hypothetical protein
MFALLRLAQPPDPAVTPRLWAGSAVIEGHPLTTHLPAARGAATGPAGLRTAKNAPAGPALPTTFEGSRRPPA